MTFLPCYCPDSRIHCSNLMLLHTDRRFQIRQSIAGYLDDKSIASYRLICRSTKHALDEDEGSFWRTRFLDTYDPSKQTPIGTRSAVNEWFKKQYQCRKRIERQRFDFQVGNSQKEMECLSLLKDLINGACPSIYSRTASLTTIRILQRQPSQVQASYNSLSQHGSSRKSCQGHRAPRVRLSPSLHQKQEVNTQPSLARHPTRSHSPFLDCFTYFQDCQSMGLLRLPVLGLCAKFDPPYLQGPQLSGD